MRLGGALLLGLMVTGAALAFGSRALGVVGSVCCSRRSSRASGPR